MRLTTLPTHKAKANARKALKRDRKKLARRVASQPIETQSLI